MKKIITIQNPHFLILACGLTLLFLVYYLLHGRYFLDDVDAAWVMSYMYNYLFYDIHYDKVFSSVLGEGLLFGKTQALLYGLILNWTGWSLSNAQIISTLLIWVAAPVWFFILKKMGYATSIAIAFVLILLMLEPTFSSANSTRAEALTFLLISLVLLLAVYRAFFLSGILTIVALETHIMGGLSSFYVLAFLLTHCRSKEKFSAWWLYGLGMIIGLPYYIALHYDYLSNILPIILGAVGANDQSILPPNLLYDYFFKTKYYRHIPELIIILASLSIFIIKKLYQQEKFIPVLLFLLLLSTIIIGRANYHYTIYIYPAFILLIVIVSQHIRHAYLSALLVFLMLIPQYGFVYATQYKYNQQEYEEVIKAKVPKDGLPVVGYSTHWFAFFKDRDFFSTFHTGNIKSLENTEKFYLIDESRFRDRRFYSSYILSFLNSCNVTIISQVVYFNSDITTKKVTCPANYQSK